MSNDFFFTKYNNYLLFVHSVYFFLFDLQLQINDQHTSVENLQKNSVKIYINMNSMKIS